MAPIVPASIVDPFADDVLADPYASFAQLRDAGAVVWLERYQCWVCARYADVRAVLRDWETFTSTAGTGLDNLQRKEPWRSPSIIAEVDPPTHTRTRAVMNRVLSAKVMEGLRESFRNSAESLTDRLIALETVDAIEEIAEAFPLGVFPSAVGLGPDGHENLLTYGHIVFNALGPHNAHFEQSIAAAAKVVPWVAAQCSRQALSAMSIGAAIWEAVDTGELTAEEAPLLVRSLLSAGLTTIAAIGNAIYAFAVNPEQWQALRRDSSLLRNAFDEVIRWESPVQMFFRTTTKATEIESVAIPADAKLLILLASANRDPRKWSEPDQFDITRRSASHVAFGSGIHLCVGQMLARLECETILAAMASKVRRIELVTEPQRKLNNTTRQFAKLPVKLIPA
jgi:cytochrome P450